MRSMNYSLLSVVLAQLALFLSLIALDIASCEESLSSTKSIQNSRQKRSRVSSDILSDSLIAEDLVDSVNKRAPGWGKRFSEDGLMEDKREPGWGKRNWAHGGRPSSYGKRDPGWGKRQSEGTSYDKREPGWGKRAPGWGKRAPGWGKREPGWGKRAPGWGKRSDDSDLCLDVKGVIHQLINWMVQLNKLEKCELGADMLDTVSGTF